MEPTFIVRDHSYHGPGEWLVAVAGAPATQRLVFAADEPKAIAEYKAKFAELIPAPAAPSPSDSAT